MRLPFNRECIFLAGCRKMTTPRIICDDFTIPRTPGDLAQYVQETYDCIARSGELRQVARLRKEPYKTFLEELVPFSHFCTWRYEDQTDVLCSLVPGTPGRDAIVASTSTGVEHSVEITWPVEGKHMIRQAREMNERGRTDMETWDYNDVSKQQAAVKRTLDIARKKALRDYRSEGGSTIIFVFDHSLFWDGNPKHMKLLNSLRTELASVPLLADNVLLLLVYGDQKRMIEVKSTKQERPGGK